MTDPTREELEFLEALNRYIDWRKDEDRDPAGMPSDHIEKFQALLESRGVEKNSDGFRWFTARMEEFKDTRGPLDTSA